MSAHQTILPLVLAEHNSTQSGAGASWCTNFSLNFDGPNDSSAERLLFWSGGLDNPRYFPLQANSYSAAGKLGAQVNVDMQLSTVISVKGFILDEVVQVGQRMNGILAAIGRPNYVELFNQSEGFLGGPWTKQPDRLQQTSESSLERGEIFALTVTGRVYTETPLDWRHWNTRNHSERLWNPRYMRDLWNESEEERTGYIESRRADVYESSDYECARDDACEGRRMALFRSGKFGLMSEFTSIGDKLVALLGCGVPMVLHMRDWNKLHRRIIDPDDKRVLYGKTWKVRGQVYIHEYMHYQGDLEADIASGKVTLETFLID